MGNDINQRSIISAGMLLGIGLGGFLDGIVFHQLLQLHNMLSAKFPVIGVDTETLAVNLEINMFWDGLFHLFCWIITAIGLAVLWRTVRRPEAPLSTRTFTGALALGWGLFNLVEGIIDHHVIHIHHVVETANHLGGDLVFLGSGVVLVLGGWGLIRTDRSDGSRADAGTDERLLYRPCPGASVARDRLGMDARRGCVQRGLAPFAALGGPRPAEETSAGEPESTATEFEYEPPEVVSRNVLASRLFSHRMCSTSSSVAIPGSGSVRILHGHLGEGHCGC